MSRRSQSGFTLIELMVSLIVIAVAVMGAVSSITSSAVLGDSNRETSLVYQAARRKLEQVRAADFRSVFALYNADPADDPPGPHPDQGADFSVPGLDARAGDADGFVGKVLFPSQVVGGIEVVREDVALPQMGMPADLNGDDVVDALDHTDDYMVLPVIVRIEWSGISGDRVVEVGAVLHSPQ